MVGSYQDVLSALLRIGCIRLPFRDTQWVPAPLPHGLIVEATSRSRVRQIKEELSGATSAYFRSRVVLRATAANTITARTLTLDCYIPRPARETPVVVILPILGGEDYTLECYFARYFAEHGLAALVVQREKTQPIVDEKQVDRTLRQSVLDDRSVIDWIETRPEFARDQIAVLGISMGGIRGALLAAVDQRVKAAVLALAGGDLPYILRHSRDGAWRGGGITGRRNEYLKQKQITPSAFERELRSGIRWDPLALAPHIQPEKILLILAACDRVIPFRKGLELRRAMGKPETIVLMSGHYSAAIFLPHLRKRTLRFFEKKLGVSIRAPSCKLPESR